MYQYCHTSLILGHVGEVYVLKHSLFLYSTVSFYISAVEHAMTLILSKYIPVEYEH